MFSLLPTLQVPTLFAVAGSLNEVVVQWLHTTPDCGPYAGSKSAYQVLNMLPEYQNITPSDHVAPCPLLQ